MTGKWQFRSRCEDPHPCRVVGIVRRQDEGGLGVIELTGNGRHLLGGQSTRVWQNGQWVSPELRVGEDIDCLEGVPSHRSLIVGLPG